MSRSLRSRPLTLYDASAVPVIPPVQPDTPSRSSSNQRIDHLRQQPPASGSPTAGPSTPSSSKPSSRLKKASQVGSNLKKRLSTRYADDNRRTSRMAAMGADVLSEMPGYLTHSQRQALQQSGTLAGLGYEDHVAALRPQRQGFGQLSTLGEGFHEGREDGLEDLAGDEQTAYVLEKSSPSGQAAGYDHPQAPNVYDQGYAAPQEDGSIDARQGANKPSSSRQPTVAWEGSALRTILDENRRKGLGRLVDIEALRRNEDFDGMEYLRLHLPPTVQPAEFSQTLDGVKGAIRGDVKSQIFDHYSDLITISGQVVALENEMIELKSLLSEWRAMPRLLEREDESGKSLISSVSALSKRSSLVTLQQVYRAQLTSLWEGIANSQKFIPYKSGRHLVAEAPDFIELNSATYKPVKNVALFLLDDLLLIAARKKGRMSTKVKLEAERCFALGDIVVVDLKDNSKQQHSNRNGLADASTLTTGNSLTGGIRDSIKIKRGKETFIYRAEKAESKKALLNAFRRVAEDLANRKKREIKGASRSPTGNELTVTQDGADLRRQSIYAGMNLDPRSGKGPALAALGGLEEEIDQDETGADGDEPGVMKLASERVKEERKDPTRWLSDWSDSLAVDIALRRWGSAVEKVGKGKAMLSTYTASDPVFIALSTRLSAHTSTLVTSLLAALKSPTLRKTALVALASHLTALGYSSAARQTFLASREELLRKRKRSIKFEGDTELYVGELSMVVFGMVRNTSEWFMATWKESGMASGFVKWALAQIHSFALTFRRQVYGNSVEASHGSTDSFDRRIDSAHRARMVAMESAQQLKDVGLDFTFVLRELLKTEEEQAALARAATAAVVAAQTTPDSRTMSSRQRTASGASVSTVGSRMSDNLAGRPATPKDETVPLPGVQKHHSPSRRTGGIANRIAEFESVANTSASSSTTPPSPRSARTAQASGGRPHRSASTSSSGSMDEVHPSSLGGRSSSRSGTYGAAGSGGAVPPVPPLPTAAAVGSNVSRGMRNNLQPAAAAASSSSSSSSQQLAPIVPSLTLTLADEASGISHRISSTDLPSISAQDIRKRRSAYQTG